MSPFNNQISTTPELYISVYKLNQTPKYARNGLTSGTSEIYLDVGTKDAILTIQRTSLCSLNNSKALPSVASIQ